jgi:hypothetical protein
MAKQVFRNSSEVAHVWASQSQQSGQNPTKNIYFEGDTIYSYGSHFEVAEIVTRGKGKRARKCALITTHGYSTTTAKHIGDAESATRHMTQFFVPLYSCVSAPPHQYFTPARGLASYRERVAALLADSAKRKGLKASTMRNARSLAEDGNRFAEWFGLKGRVRLPATFDADLAAAIPAEDKLHAALEARRAAESAEYASVRAKREARYAEIRANPAAHIADWRSGKGEIEVPDILNGFDLLRVNGDEIETTRGAYVPTGHAKRAYAIFRKLRDAGKTYQSNGHAEHVGHYTIDSLDENGIVSIGCHRIEWSEIERLATSQGW